MGQNIIPAVEIGKAKMADLDRRIYHIHPYKQEGDTRHLLTDGYKTIVKPGDVIHTKYHYDNGVGERTVTISRRQPWKAMVVEGGRSSFNLFPEDFPLGSPHTRDLRGWRNLPFHPRSFLGVGYPSISSMSRGADFVKAENWFKWQLRRGFSRNSKGNNPS